MSVQVKNELGDWENISGDSISTMRGATAQTDGEIGLPPKPLAGDEDKVLQGNGNWGKKLQIDVVIQNGEYGYIGANDTFIPFKSQSDIEAAVRAAMVGNATAADVLSGKTFTNSSSSGLSGSIPTIAGGTYVKSATRDSTNGAWVYIPYGYYAGQYENGTSQWLKLTDANCVTLANKQEKTVTAGTSASSVTPDSGKLLSKVTYNPTPSQTKSTTSSRSAQTITPDSGKLLSSVSIAKYPDASGNYTCDSNNGAASSNDMGATNNYRYVNATAVYSKGKADGSKITLNTDYTLLSSGGSVSVSNEYIAEVITIVGGTSAFNPVSGSYSTLRSFSRTLGFGANNDTKVTYHYRSIQAKGTNVVIKNTSSWGYGTAYRITAQ